MQQPLQVGSLEQHPTFQAMIGEVQEAKRQRETEKLTASMEVAAIRLEQVEGLKHSLKAQIDLYEEKRKELHSLLGDIHFTEMKLSALLGRATGLVPDQVFKKIHLPRLAPPPLGMHSNLDVGVSTTEAALGSYYSNPKPGWPNLGYV